MKLTFLLFVIFLQPCALSGQNTYVQNYLSNGTNHKQIITQHMDTAQRLNPESSSWKWLITGQYWQNKKGNFGFGYAGLLGPQILNFNTVDGWTYRQSYSLNFKPDSIQHFSYNQVLSYAINRKALIGISQFVYDYSLNNHGKFCLTGESGSSDFNESDGINPYINSITSLFFRKNYSKLFDKKAFQVSNTIDLNKETNLTVTATYTTSRLLQNHSDYSFFYRHKRNYTSNIPDNLFFLPMPVSPFRSFALEAQLNFTPQSYYKYINRYNILVNSQSPIFSLIFKAAIPDVFNSDAAYQFISGGISQQLQMSKNTKFFYEIKTGTFLNVDKLFFSDYKHFNTQPMSVVITDFDNSFQLLNYYKYSTSRYFVESHFKYSTMYLFLKYLPWIRDHFWTENLYFNYLNTPVLKHYTEFGYGLGQLVFLLNLDVYASFESGTFRSAGLKFCIGRY